MRYARLALTVLTFCLAASGSIWIGWIYAGPHPRIQTPPNPTPTSPPSSKSPRTIDVGMDQLPPGMNGLSADFGSPIPDLGNIDIIPGASGNASNVADLNGFPTISREAIERASGYGNRDLPEVEAPFKLDGDDTTPSKVATPRGFLP